MIAMASQRTLTAVEETRMASHLEGCATCRALDAERPDDWRWISRYHDVPVDDSEWFALPVVNPEVFERDAPIAAGGMGQITRACDRRLGREVAIKEVLDHALHARFEREALITARLQHP